MELTTDGEIFLVILAASLLLGTLALWFVSQLPTWLKLRRIERKIDGLAPRFDGVRPGDWSR